MDVQQDGNAYAAMGHALQLHGGFWMPWGDGLGLDTTPAWSHHFAPAYPTYLAGIYSLLGFGVWQTKVAAAFMAAISLATIYATTRNLYGKTPALLTTSLAALIPRLIIVEGTGFSENLALTCLTITLWAVIKSTTNQRYVILAGAMAGLSYLTRTSTGPFLFLAALGGVAWRIRFKGIRGILNPYYLTAATLALTPILWWVYRNWTMNGDLTGSNYQAAANSYAIQHPLLWGLAFTVKLGLFLGLIYLIAMPFKPEFRAALTKKAQETDSALWLTIALITGLGALISASIWTVERTPLLWLDAERYLIYAYIPLLWLLFKDAKPTKNLYQRHASLALILAIWAAFFLIQPTQDPATTAASHLSIHDGESLGILNGSLGRYNTYLYLPTQNVTLAICNGPPNDPCLGSWPDYILGKGTQLESTAYQLQRTDATHFLIGGESTPVYTYAKVKP